MHDYQFNVDDFFNAKALIEITFVRKRGQREAKNHEERGRWNTAAAAQKHAHLGPKVGMLCALQRDTLPKWSPFIAYVRSPRP